MSEPVRTALGREEDPSLAARVATGDRLAFEGLMRRHNGRLFRVARAILKDDADAEDALQEAYLEAYRHIAGFKGQASVVTWLTRIVINQSFTFNGATSRSEAYAIVKAAEQQTLATIRDANRRGNDSLIGR